MCADIDPEILEELRQESPIGRHGTPDDVAASIEYLANAPFVTGQVLGVNGGFVI
jgi:NAD(P)-dependent dehydrogenase (short-subunit alcohol dehydrogenase family)